MRLEMSRYGIFNLGQDYDRGHDWFWTWQGVLMDGEQLLLGSLNLRSSSR